DRIRFMIEDAGLRFLLTQDRWRIQCEDWRGGTLRQIIHTDSRAEEFDIFPAANPPPKSSGVSTAYVMYTSGSTGQPKGAVVTQRGVSRLVLNTNYVRFQPGDVIGHISNTSFDAATFEIWGALLNGARLRVIPRDTVLSMADFARVIAGERVGIMFLTAAVFNQFARENPAAFSTMRYLLAGGEALDPPSVREVIEHGKPEHLLNGYGPTENTTFTACHLITEVPANAKSIPIGKPISNTRIHIMDSRLRPVPIGVPGELCIGGDGLAAGYLNRPELTAEKFVEAPREIEPEGRIYKTGDLVRWRADGTIEFIGRMDNQIKLRGFRIELGEIESALSSHEDIAQCAAMLREDAPGDKFIAAYLIPRAGKQIQVNALRAWLKTRLPEYMIPSAFVTLDTFPLNPNGKIDRRKLPAPEQTRAQTEYAAPQNSVEEELQAIWARVLGIPAPGRDDNFFDLGGHSLLVVRLMEGIRKSFGRTLPVSAIFQAATIADQSRLLEESVRTREHPDVIEIQPRGNKPPIFFAHGRGNSPLNLIHLARRLGEDQPIFGLQAPWLEGGRREFAQVEFMADHYIRAMKAFRPEGPYVLAGYCLDGLIAFEMARRMRERGEEIPLLILIETLGNNESFRTLRGFIRLIAGTARLPETAQLRLFLAARQCLLLGGRSLKALRGAASVKGLKLLLSRVRHYPMPVVWRRIRAVKTAPDPHAAGMSKDGKGGRRPRNAAQPPAGATLFRDLWTLHGAYVPEEYGGRVLVARSESGGGFPGTERSHLGWEKVVKGRLDRIEIPGSHWSLLREPNVAVLGAEIEKHLREIL
ncbi:amino acid adenylation domain-containing protein, partial [Candidatus Sumerlaeota bacterium]|nr:amino acid adenylation domain-containing protein [Candidatus Sumerlaeota bacterium]